MNTSSKIALVTGANRGLGLAICRELGRRGMILVVAARGKDKGVEAAETLKSEGFDAHPLILSVTHQPSIKRAAAYIAHEFGRLDVLINNAGIMEDQSLTPSTTPLEILHDIFDTNCFGAIAVAQAMLPFLRQSDAGRIVNMSSSLGSLTLQADPSSPFASFKLLGYNSSKAALNSFTIHLAWELRDTPIKVNSACPGWVKTEMGGPNAPGTVEEGADTPVWLATLPADGPSGGFFNSRKQLPW